MTRMDERKGSCRFLIGKNLKGKRPLERLRRRWQAAINMYLQETEWWRGMDLSGSP